MAVSFKVPKSPAKDIFDIDTFLGVDLTNSGADMDERRSPNAENMVRYVPGKVRKRTGYEKEILFAPKVNVNFALGTSSDEQIFNLKNNISEDHKKIYDVSTDFPTVTNYLEVCVELDYKSSGRVGIQFDAPDYWSGSVGEFELESSAEWTHYSDRFHLDLGIESAICKSLTLRSYVSRDIDVHIKNFSLMLDTDENYKWSLAPKHYIETSDNDAVYGCHIGKAGTFEGNRVVNVNRALNTESSTTLNLTTTKQTVKNIHEHFNVGTTAYIEFDYTFEITSGSPLGEVYIQSHEVRGSLQETSFGSEHFSGKVEIDYAAGSNVVEMKVSEGTATVKVANLSVMYDKDENYRWSAAPEDTGGTFHIEDLYNLGSENLALIDSATVSKNATSGSCMQEITIVDTNTDYETVYYEFKISTETAEEVDYIDVSLKTGLNYTVWTQRFQTNLSDDTIKIYVYAEDYPSKLRIDYTLENSGTGECKTQISGLKIYRATIKQSFDISPKWLLYHAGSGLYLRASNSNDIIKAYNNANKHISRSWQLNKNLYIIDGDNIYIHEIGKGTVQPIDKSNAYIPTVTIAKEPSGGGTSYEPINLLQPGFYEMFQGHSGVTQFQLTFKNLDYTKCKAWVLNSSGSWEYKKEGTDFSVNRSTGKITFNTAPGSSPITGEDNVKVLAYRTIDDYRERITHCTHGALYGVGGAGDRLFLAGNPDHPNWDFYSQQYDPTYFPDTNYATLGSEQSLITGYAVVNNYLATFKDGFDQSQAVFIREGDLLKTSNSSDNEEEEAETTEAVFKLINTLQGEGVIAPYTFGYIQTEPLFLSKHGIYAITEQDITGEKYTQSRSFYLDGQLRKEPNPENAISCIYDNQYILALNNHLYILDGLQATRTDKSEPYATRQYAGFYCTNVPAICIWQDDGVWFGTNDGRVCAFYTDIESLTSYNDDGDAIYSCWETPDLDGKLFYKNKTFRYFAVRLMQAIKTSAKLYSRKLGVWNFIREETVIGNPIDFENFDFELFTFSQDTTEKVLHTKVRVKKVDKARFRVENGEMNEPFGLFDLALEYIESGNYKG